MLSAGIRMNALLRNIILGRRHGHYVDYDKLKSILKNAHERSGRDFDLYTDEELLEMERKKI